MSSVTRNAIAIPAGYASQEVASFVAQLDDQLRRQKEQTRTLTPADLEWQPAPGMNTIGMLTAHQAIVEVGWTRPRTRPDGEPREVEVRWVIYHMLEHFAGHFGQILLLQHARQALGVGDAAGR